jgi:uncharacterized ion transporter superfamily protein YfcC
MPKQQKFLTPLTILMCIIVLAAGATWIIPAGKYNTLSYKDGHFIIETPDSAIVVPFTKAVTDSLHIQIPLKAFEDGEISKPISIPDSYHRLKKNQQGIISILKAPIKGIYETIDIILFVLLLGGFINIFYASGAIEKGIARLCYKMKGKETWLIISLSFIFIAGGTTYGMDAEAMAFYPILVPVFLAAGLRPDRSAGSDLLRHSNGAIIFYLQSIFNCDRFKHHWHQLDQRNYRTHYHLYHYFNHQYILPREVCTKSKEESSTLDLIPG